MNREAERKRLVEMADSFLQEELGAKLNKDILGKFAKHLLDNGVIIPKYEIGQKFYIITPHRIYHSSYEICGIQFTDELRYIYCDVCDDDFMSFGEEDVGKTIFFSEEEAEKMLKRKEDEGK